ncbi:MAG: GxxExxY protein [Verrucomicrobia bacterium]|nr:GxxExxY protein [Verrucomicrobiota bacterium]MBU4289628.1 GxxExxY protein [Verrucomicrobiota bacterium]MBU4430145.1 GxxExxY protein [Verrucomicrobiota bacterium]MCG2679492.1 GxxExxY protein [Kiritimatiellia bacterium]
MGCLIHEKSSEAIIGAAMTILNELKPGLDEKLYQNALVIELQERGHSINQQKEFTRKKILIIDDEPDMVEIMVELITDQGYQTFGATNGADGIIINEKENPDLIILDLHMPGMDGMETLRQIRKKDGKVRVIILSGFLTESDSPDTVKDMADLDVSERLSKPIENDQLLRIIGDVLTR